MKAFLITVILLALSFSIVAVAQTPTLVAQPTGCNCTPIKAADLVQFDDHTAFVVPAGKVLILTGTLIADTNVTDAMVIVKNGVIFLKPNKNDPFPFGVSFTAGTTVQVQCITGTCSVLPANAHFIAFGYLINS